MASVCIDGMVIHFQTRGEFDGGENQAISLKILPLLDFEKIAPYHLLR